MSYDYWFAVIDMISSDKVQLSVEWHNKVLLNIFLDLLNRLWLQGLPVLG